MSNIVKALVGLAEIKSPRGLAWTDLRNRSPKALGDMSGIILPRVGAPNGYGVQDFDYHIMGRLHACSDIAWTCINLVSSTVAQGRLKVRINDGKTITYVPDHPLQAVLNSSNETMTQFDLLQSYVTHQLLYGTVGILLLRQDMVRTCPLCLALAKPDCLHKLYLNTDGPVAQLMTVHPALITNEFIDVDGVRMKLLVYSPGDGNKYPIHPNNILTDPFYNPEVSWYGISPTYLLKRWLDLDDTMTQQAKDLFDNGSIPSMIINVKPSTNYIYEQEPATVMEEMKEKWQAQFSSKRGKHAKSPAFMYGDVTATPLQEKLDNNVAKSLYEEIQNRACAVYGVPPTLYEFGIRYAGKGAASTQPEQDFYNRTISKILIRIRNKINMLVVPSFNTPGLEVDWDLSEMPIASFIVQAQKDAVKADWEMGLISRDTARVLLGYDPVGGELGDDFYRLTVMSDGSNTSQAQGMDNRLKVPASDGTAGHNTNK